MKDLTPQVTINRLTVLASDLEYIATLMRHIDHGQANAYATRLLDEAEVARKWVGMLGPAAAGTSIEVNEKSDAT